MKTILITSLLGAAATLAACSTAASARSTSGAQIVSITPEVRAEIVRQGHDPDEEVCRREAPTGSTIPKNTCATRAAWAAKAQASKEGTADMQRNGLRTRDPNAGS